MTRTFLHLLIVLPLCTADNQTEFIHGETMDQSTTVLLSLGGTEWFVEWASKQIKALASQTQTIQALASQAYN